jgi:hypothetical protein
VELFGAVGLADCCWSFLATVAEAPDAVHVPTDRYHMLPSWVVTGGQLSIGQRLVVLPHNYNEDEALAERP